jgi:hypothetical protein
MVRQKREKIYIAEFNRPRWDNISACARRLERRYGLDVEIVPHKSTLRIKLPKGKSWIDLKNALRAVLQPMIGSVVLFSKRTGNAFRCSNKGNWPGDFWQSNRQRNRLNGSAPAR